MNNTSNTPLQGMGAIDYTKYADGLVPAIIQDAETNKVLMLGFMNEAAFNKTQELQKVTFYSRSKNRLWTKGADRKNNPTNKSYTSSLFAKGINKIAQKVGEEAVEVVIEAVNPPFGDGGNDLFKNEAADLLFHYLILLQAKGFKLNDVVDILKDRHSK